MRRLVGVIAASGVWLIAASAWTPISTAVEVVRVSLSKETASAEVQPTTAISRDAATVIRVKQARGTSATLPSASRSLSWTSDSFRIPTYPPSYTPAPASPVDGLRSIPVIPHIPDAVAAETEAVAKPAALPEETHGPIPVLPAPQSSGGGDLLEALAAISARQERAAVTPIAPATPSVPATPAAPARPAAPEMPVASAKPAAPEMPVASATPAASVTPAASEMTVASAKPAAPVEPPPRRIVLSIDSQEDSLDSSPTVISTSTSLVGTDLFSALSTVQTNQASQANRTSTQTKSIQPTIEPKESAVPTEMTAKAAIKDVEPEVKSDDGLWSPYPLGDHYVIGEPVPPLPAAIGNGRMVAPNRFTAADAQQMADRLATTRLALQPANDAPQPPTGSQDTTEDAIPTPAEDQPAFQSVPSDLPAGPDTIAGAERLGEEPVDNTLQFLRSVAVLLDPGEWQWDVGLEYAFSHNDVPIIFVDGGGFVIDVDEGQVRRRELVVPFAIRYGLNRRTQLFVDVPVGWSNTELSFNGSDEFDNDGGVGDVTFGGTFLLNSNECRDVTFTFAATAPTGGDPFGFVGQAFPAASLGDGFWALSGDLLCIRTYDPLVVFTSVGTKHYFERNHLGNDILPGSEWRWSLGLGLAVSPKVTLSTSFFAAYIEESKINGARVPGTIQEPMAVRMAATISQGCRWVEPFVTFGTNDDANTTVFGVIYTY